MAEINDSLKLYTPDSEEPTIVYPITKATNVVVNDSTGKTIDKAIAGSESYISNVNIIDNSTFKINQRSQTSYEMTGENDINGNYCVDRWITNNFSVGEGVQLADNGILITVLETGSNFPSIEQYVEGGFAKYTGKNLTMSFSINGTIHTMTGSCPTELSASTIVNISNTDIISDSGIAINEDGKIKVFIKVNSTCTINWVKLEEGSICTRFVTPDYRDDFFHCITSTADSADTYANKIVNTTQSNKQIVANAEAVSDLSVSQVRNITAGTEDLTAGTSDLATGDIYIVYE